MVSHPPQTGLPMPFSNPPPPLSETWQTRPNPSSISLSQTENHVQGQIQGRCGNQKQHCQILRSNVLLSYVDSIIPPQMSHKKDYICPFPKVAEKGKHFFVLPPRKISVCKLCPASRRDLAYSSINSRMTQAMQMTAPAIRR